MKRPNGLLFLFVSLLPVVLGATDMKKLFDTSQHQSHVTKESRIPVNTPDFSGPLTQTHEDVSSVQPLLNAPLKSQHVYDEIFPHLDYVSPHQISERRVAHLWPKSLSAFLSNTLSVYVVPSIVLSLFYLIYAHITGHLQFVDALTQIVARFALSFACVLALQILNVLLSAILQRLRLHFILFSNASFFPRRIIQGFDVHFYFIFLLGLFESQNLLGINTFYWSLDYSGISKTYGYYIISQIYLTMFGRYFRVLNLFIYWIHSMVTFFPHTDTRTLLERKIDIFIYQKINFALSFFPYLPNHVHDVSLVVKKLFLTTQVDRASNLSIPYFIFRMFYPVLILYSQSLRGSGMRSIFEWRYISKSRLPWIIVGRPPNLQDICEKYKRLTRSYTVQELLADEEEDKDSIAPTQESSSWDSDALPAPQLNANNEGATDGSLNHDTSIAVDSLFTAALICLIMPLI
jgi:hypothetical protein